MPKYTCVTKRPCLACRRPDVDAVRISGEPGLKLSRHFPPGTFKFCGNSLITVNAMPSSLEGVE